VAERRDPAEIVEAARVARARAVEAIERATATAARARAVQAAVRARREAMRARERPDDDPPPVL
jgi:hypothetical protein